MMTFKAFNDHVNCFLQRVKWNRKPPPTNKQTNKNAKFVANDVNSTKQQK